MALFVKDRGFYRTFFSMTAVVALQNLIVFGVNLADNVMIGQYSEDALSGVAIVNQIQFLLQMIVVGGLGDALAVVSSRYWGAKDLSAVKKLMSVSFLMSVCIAVLFWLIMFFFPAEVLSLFTKDAGVIAEGVAYTKIVCFTYLFFSVTNVILASLRSIETVRIGFIVSLVALVINVFLNYVLIFGNFGAPRLGTRGAAIATLTARIVETGIVVCYILKIDRKLSMKGKAFFQPDFQLAKLYLKVGYPVILAGALWGIAMAIQTAILGNLGSQAIAANSIATTLFQVVTVVSMAAGSVTAVMVGKTIGKGETEKIPSYTKTFQILFLLIGVATGMGLFLLREPVLGFYEITPETREMTNAFIAVLSITVVGTSYQVPCLCGIVRGGGDTRFVFVNDTIFMWILVLPASAIAAFVLHLSPLAVFICLKADQILKCIVAVVKVNRYTWLRDWHRGTQEAAL